MKKISLPWLDSPEVTAGETWISVRGGRQVTIENHRGLLEYTDRSVTVRVPEGLLRIEGTELTVREVYADSLCVAGAVRSLTMLG